MPEESDRLPADVELMRDLLDEEAEIYLQLHEIEFERSEDQSRFESDGHALSMTIGRSTLADELANTTAIYLFETPHELKALAMLLNANQIAGSLEVLSRAAIERCGRVSWLLDHDAEVTPTVRAARIALEITVSWQHYRRIIQSSYKRSHDANKEADIRFREMRSHLEAHFDQVDKEPSTDNDGLVTPSAEIKSWKLDGVEYPDYTDLATWAWYGAAERSKSAKSTYALLCAFSHPSIAASREHQVVVDGNLTYRYEIRYINLIVSNTVAAFDKAFQSFCSYFDRNFYSVQSQLATIHDRWPPLNDEGPESADDDDGATEHLTH